MTPNKPDYESATAEDLARTPLEMPPEEEADENPDHGES